MGRPRLRALVLATTGGDDLARTLASLPSRVDDALVLDPLARARAVSARCISHRAVADEVDGGWVLGLIEGEQATAALGESIAAALAESVPRPAGALLVHRGAGWELRLRRPAARLAPAGGFRLDVGRSSTLALVPDGREATCLDGMLVTDHGPIDAALSRLDATAEALAALLPSDAGAPGVWATACAGARAGGAALVARAPSRLGWGRWIGSVLLGYRAVLVRAKLLERQGRGWGG